MKCDNCGFTPNPGDQICINCGAKLSIINAVVPEVDVIESKNDTKNNKKIIIISIIGVLLFIIVVFIIIRIFVLKG